MFRDARFAPRTPRQHPGTIDDHSPLCFHEKSNLRPQKPSGIVFSWPEIVEYLSLVEIGPPITNECLHCGAAPEKPLPDQCSCATDWILFRYLLNFRPREPTLIVLCKPRSQRRSFTYILARAIFAVTSVFTRLSVTPEVCGCRRRSFRKPEVAEVCTSGARTLISNCDDRQRQEVSATNSEQRIDLHDYQRGQQLSPTVCHDHLTPREV